MVYRQTHPGPRSAKAFRAWKALGGMDRPGFNWRPKDLSKAVQAKERRRRKKQSIEDKEKNKENKNNNYSNRKPLHLYFFFGNAYMTNN